MVNVEVAEVMVELSVTLDGLRFVVSPEGKEKIERLIVPENPDPFRVIVELPDEPGFSTMKIGLAVRAKDAPVTWTWMKVFLVIAPFVPVMRMP